MSALLFVSILASAIIAAQCAVVTTLPTTTPAGCTWNGQWYPAGQRFNPDPCTFCNCDNGRAMCAVMDCMVAQCVDIVRDPTKCCPTCPNGLNCRAPDGSIIKMGETVQIGGATCQCEPFGGFMSSGHAVCTMAAIKPVAHVDPVLQN